LTRRLQAHQGAPGLGNGDPAGHRAGAVAAPQGDHLAGEVDHDDGQRGETPLGADVEGSLHQPVGIAQRQSGESGSSGHGRRR
jgi:hypothetical protein